MQFIFISNPFIYRVAILMRRKMITKINIKAKTSGDLNSASILNLVTYLITDFTNNCH